MWLKTILGFFSSSIGARVFLVLDDLQQDLVQPLDDVRLRFAQGHLVGNLEDVAQRLGAFAVKAAHGQADFVDRLDDLVDLLGQDQAGQMQHGADAHAGAEVGRAGGQVAELGAEGEIELALQFGVDLVDGHARPAELQAGPQGLHPQMVLLVDHHAERFLLVDDQAAAGVLGGVFAADQMALDENLFVQRPQVIHRLGKGPVQFRQALHGRTDDVQRLDASVFLAHPGKAAPRRLRASRTRLDITIRSCGPVRRAVSAGGMRNSWMFMASAGARRESSWSLAALISSRRLAACSKSSALTALSSFFCKCFRRSVKSRLWRKRRGHFAHVFGALVHRLEQTLQPLGKSRVTLRATQPSGLLEIGLRKPAVGALDHPRRRAGRFPATRPNPATDPPGENPAGR